MKRFTLLVYVVVSVSLVLAACAPPTPEVVEKEVVIEKPVVETVVVEKEKVVEKPVVETVVVEKEVVLEKIVTPTPVPPPKVGKHLIGKLEGPTIITDPAQYPKKFNEAPILAKLVEGEKLPPVEERLPVREDLMIIKPLHEIGKYGGTWRRGFLGTADAENGSRLNSMDHILFWDYTGTKVMPCVAKGWEVSDDGRTITIFLRKGMKWSDGAPFTADDFMFWFEDMYMYTDLNPSPVIDMMINGKPGTMEKVDDYTVAYKFPDPYPQFPEILATDSKLGGMYRWGPWSNFMGGYAPAHYLKRFHPKYVPVEELERKAKEERFDSWKSRFAFKYNYSLNPELPTVGPWITTSPANTSTWVMERNPYFYAVDTEGNQLPYIDRIVMTLAEDVEVLNLRAIAGEYDHQSRHIDLAKLPVILENADRSGYDVHLDPTYGGSWMTVIFNQSYKGDPEIVKWITNRDFRRALSLGIDRDQLNEIFCMGIGTSGSIAPNESVPESPGPEYRTLWSTYDPDKANEMLDAIGLDQKDSEGYRLRTDGEGRLRLPLVAILAFLPYGQINEMIADHWKKIGIQADVVELERSLAFARINANEIPILVWNAGVDPLLLSPRHMVSYDADSPTGPLHGLWFSSGGELGEKPTDPQILKSLELVRKIPGLPYEERVEVGKEIWRIVIEEQWEVGTVALTPQGQGTRIASRKMGNIPSRHVYAQNCRTPGCSLPPTFYFKE